jgi:hypothetical protein
MKEIDCPKNCHTCEELNKQRTCSIRMQEWLKGINTIISKKRPKGEGTRMANELIHFMKHEFMNQI